MENEIFLNTVLNFMKIAGKIALECQENLSVAIKKDESIVTEADLTISRMFHERINDFITNNNHKILDEENLPKIEELFNNNPRYLWTIDPIDGTTTYYHGFPMWAIAISLYKDLKPYISAIYMPKMKELIYTDSKKSYFVKNAFADDEIKIVLESKPKTLTKKSIILQHKLQNFNNLKYTTLDLYSSYVLAFYTLIGNSAACFFNKPMKLWDITATLPIAYNLGIAFRDIKTGIDLEKLKIDMIDENWYIKNTYIMCDKDNYKDIVEIIK